MIEYDLETAVRNIRALELDCADWPETTLRDIALCALAAVPEFKQRALETLTDDAKTALAQRATEVAE